MKGSAATINIGRAALLISAVKPEQFPAEGLPEFAFVGKSNVGKSSLLNALAGRKRLARVSQSPGKTRTINFFNIDNRLIFTDLPGYGYAKISREASRKWGAMAERYLLNREPLRAIFMLADIRHEPSELDRQMFEWLNHYGFNFYIIATKADKLKRSQVPRQLKILREAYNTNVYPFSSETLNGRNELWDVINSITRS
ncbi:MAG: ribosome biogenesis GTP-binding protein YihA/YsxC [Clostridiales bacterium]|jgi:GTP-binding protein|nr:ribosome biogenesis GTP-binding protein YihA/YsxC [Clostridiales bacterium]